jgi:DNA mismatch repair protein MutS
MKELRTILKNADDRTLVLGDELSRGTEAASAILLSLPTISRLVKRKSLFIFSTHQHDLVETQQIIELYQNKKLKIKHLDVRYDPGGNA